jgi:hypothetical protein
MFRLLKKLIGLVVVLIVLAIGLVIFLNSIAKAGLEKGAGYALGVGVATDSVDVGLTSGGVNVSSLAVADPPGFSSSPMIKVRKTDLVLPYKTLFSEKVEVPSLVIEDIDLAIRRDKSGATNYGYVVDRLKKFQSGEKSSGGKKFVVKEVILRRITVSAAIATGIIDTPPISFTIPEIKLENVGSKDDKGAGIDEIVASVFEAILRGVQAGGGNVLPKEILADLQGKLGGLKTLEEQGAKILGGDGKAIGDLIGGVRGLFGK